jgi:CzcA family heavy metal efflux pump
MIRSIVGTSLKLRYIVILLAGAMMVFGISKFPHMPVDVFPEFAPVRVEVQTATNGLSAEEAESFVTVPLEQALNGVENLDYMQSKSVPDESSIEMIFKPGTDELKARQMVQERMQQVIPSLPTWAAPPVMIPPISVTGRFMKIGVTSDTMSQIDMSMIAYWTIRARIMQVPGVANVAIWGERIKLPQVQIDPKRMAEQGVTVEEVMETTSEALDVGLLQFDKGNVIGTGGFIDSPNQRFHIRPVSSIKSAKDLAQIRINDRKKKDGTPLVLSDVANVVVETWPVTGEAVINGKPGLLLIVEKYPWANTLEATRGVEDALKEIQIGLPEMKIDPTIFRPADFIEVAFHNLKSALLLGCALVAVIIAAFLFEWRTALISLLAIPLSLVAGILALYYTGSTLNTMILAGFVIAIGVVVDDAIIDVENIVRRLRECRNKGIKKSTARIILEASLEVRQAIIHATLIDVVVLIPIFFIGGLSGAFFKPLAVSYGLAVMASMAVALTVTPALCYIFLRNAAIEHREPIFVRWLHEIYAPTLARIIHRPAPVFIATAAVMAVGIAIIPLLGESLFPEFKERDFLSHCITKPGTSVAEERRIVTLISNEVRAIPGVRNFGTHIGMALLADEVCGVNFGENWLSIEPDADYDETLDKIKEVVGAHPGIFRNVETYLNERIDEVLTGTSEAFVVRIFGTNLKEIHAKADEMKATLKDIPGIVDLHVQLQSEVPQIQVTVDLEKARKVGLKPGDIRRTAATLMSGEEVGDIFLDGKCYDVNVWSTPATRHSLDDVRNLLIDKPGGGRVKLADVADVAIRPAQSVIYRKNGSRRIDVSANIDQDKSDLGTVMREVQSRLDKIKLPMGYYTEVLGEFAERQAAQYRMMLFAIGGCIGVFLILLASFNNTRLAILGFLTLPSALVGGLLAAYFTGDVITLGSLVGFLTVFGIAARNKIMLINHYQHLEKYEGEVFGPHLALRGAIERLSPILMTALATGLALVPLVILGNIPGHEIEYPMAIVILGGMVTSTLLNLFVVPSLYLRFGRSTSEPMTEHSAKVEELQPALVS